MLAISLREGITPEHLQEVYSDPFIARAGHDHRAFQPVNHPLASYLTATAGDMFAGAFLAIRTSHFEIEAHALIKRVFVEESREFGHEFLSWAFSIDGVQRVSANIREGLGSVRNYCLKLGFQQEGFKRQALMHCGQLEGIYMMGITKQDWRMKWVS